MAAPITLGTANTLGLFASGVSGNINAINAINGNVTIHGNVGIADSTKHTNGFITTIGLQYSPGISPYVGFGTPAQAVEDSLNAYFSAFVFNRTQSIGSPVSLGDASWVAGRTIFPGVTQVLAPLSFGINEMLITGPITFSGSASDQFIIRIPSNVNVVIANPTPGSPPEVFNFTGGVTAGQVYWIVGDNVSTGPPPNEFTFTIQCDNFVGNILTQGFVNFSPALPIATQTINGSVLSANIFYNVSTPIAPSGILSSVVFNFNNVTSPINQHVIDYAQQNIP